MSVTVGELKARLDDYGDQVEVNIAIEEGNRNIRIVDFDVIFNSREGTVDLDFVT